MYVNFKKPVQMMDNEIEKWSKSKMLILLEVSNNCLVKILFHLIYDRKLENKYNR